jgi:hypothetical protein
MVTPASRSIWRLRTSSWESGRDFSLTISEGIWRSGCDPISQSDRHCSLMCGACRRLRVFERRRQDCRSTRAPEGAFFMMRRHLHRVSCHSATAALMLMTLGAAPDSLGQLCDDQQTLAASDVAAGDEFGISVAIDGDTAVVGARLDDNASGADAGSAYVYVRSGPPGSEVWTEQAKLIGANTTGGYPGSETGISVAISGDTAIVGSWLWPSVQAIGAAYVFVRSGPPGNEVWTQQAFLTNTGFGGAFQYFGYSVALQGDTALVGGLQQPGLNVAGLAIFFERTGETWTPDAVHPSDGVVGDQFGNAVAISTSEDTAVIGAYAEDNAGGVDAGSAYVFARTGSAQNPWVEQAKLTASDGATDDRFGVKVAINGAGDTIVVGSYQNDDAGSSSGSAYVFVRSGSPGSYVWTQQAKLTASDAAAGDAFGVSLALGGTGDTAVIGAYADDNPGGSDAGSAYVFTRAGTVWTQQQKLTAPDGDAEDWFGAAVALDGNTPVIGTRQNDNAVGANAGSAHVFECLPGGPACPGDTNGSGAVDVDDLVAVILGWGPCGNCAPPNCPADVNGSCAVDVDDLIAVILGWGPCS